MPCCDAAHGQSLAGEVSPCFPVNTQQPNQFSEPGHFPDRKGEPCHQLPPAEDLVVRREAGFPFFCLGLRKCEIGVEQAQQLQARPGGAWGSSANLRVTAQDLPSPLKPAALCSQPSLPGRSQSCCCQESRLAGAELCPCGQLLGPLDLGRPGLVQGESGVHAGFCWALPWLLVGGRDFPLSD